MSSFDQAADRINAAVEKAEVGSEILSQVANGDEFTEVPTTSGPVPSLKKWQKDNINFISGGVIARVDKAILSYTDYAAASAAAASLPDGQIVEVTDFQERYEVQSGSLVFVSSLPDKKLGAFVVPEMFGQTDTPVNTAAALNAAATYCRANAISLRAGSKAYTLGADVNLRSVKLDFSACSITVNDGFLLTIGGNAGTTINPEQIFGIVKKPRAWSLIPDDYTTPTVRCIGAKGQTIRISQVDRIQFYQSTNPATYPADASQAYSKFFIDLAVVLGVDTDPTYDGGPSVDGPASANQWFNENQFFLGRVISFYMRGSYRHNNNRVFGGCFETANGYLNIQVGNKNHFMDLRCEGATSIVFGPNTLGNIVDVNWFSSEAQIYQQPPAGGTVIDNGTLNIIKDSRISPTASDCVLLVSAQDTVHDGQPGNYAFRASTRLAVRGVPRTTSRLVAESDFIDAQVGDYFFASVESRSGSSSSYILRIYLYDSSMNPIAGDAANLETSNFTNVFSDRSEGRVNNAVAHHRFGILNSSVRYVRLEVLTSGSASEDNALRIQVNRVSRMPGRSRETTIANTRIGRFAFVTSTPTKFVGKIGDMVAGSASDFRCVFFLDTTLTVAAAPSANVITPAATTVASLGSVANGDLIGIDLDDGTTHWTTISGIGGGNLTLTTALPSAAAAGSRVYVSRLAVR